MRRLGWVGLGLAGCTAALFTVNGTLRAADHKDSPSVQAEANFAADINDLYTWMTGDATKVNLAMTVFGFAEDGAQFSDAVQYVFHVNSAAEFGAAQTETLVMCTFAADQTIQCWAGDEYVTGDASAEAGITSEGGGLKVFAGLRNDPFFFNLDGFNATVDIVKGAAGGLEFDEEGCPAVDGPTSGVLVDQLQSDANGDPATDDFAGFNTLTIVAQVDKDIVASGGDILGVWASSNAAE